MAKPCKRENYSWVMLMANRSTLTWFMRMMRVICTRTNASASVKARAVLPSAGYHPLRPAGKRESAAIHVEGQRKKKDSLTSLLKEEIKKICPADREKRTWKELIVGATLQLAMKGNAAALREVWDRLDGKILQTGNCSWVMLMANRLILMWFMRMMKRVISTVLPQSTVCKIRITI